MNEESKLELRKIRAFDYFNLLEKEELESWLNRNKNAISTQYYQFGNLKVYSNRKVLFDNLFKELNIETTEYYDKSIFEKAIVRFAERYMNEEDSILKFGNNISNFGAYIDQMSGINVELYNHFYDLKELSELRFDTIENWQEEVTRICKTIIKTKSDDT